MRHFGLIGLAITCVSSVAIAQQPFSLEESIGTPDWLTLHGETRGRFESLDGQFRAGLQGSDQVLLLRTLLFMEADTGPVSLGLELQDSRAYLADDSTPLSTSLVNPLDVLQLYARFDRAPGLLGEDSESRVILGRQTVSIGSKRQIERVDFANVIFNYTGVHLISEADRGDQLHLLFAVPVERLPDTRPALDNNELSGDKEQWSRRIWGVHYRRADIMPGVIPGLWGEVFVYGLEEEDTRRTQTPDRSHVAPGFRLYRQPRTGHWDIELEAALRRGTRHASSSPTDTQDLQVRASMLYAAVGYSFDRPWRPRLSLEYYFASGDDDPDDLEFGQHERLFGSRRTDLNNTSIHGPLTPANLSAPGFRLQLTPHPRWDGWLQYHAAYLASATDSWVVARRRDPIGESGRFIGHAVDARARYWIVPDTLGLEIGASGLHYGEFARSAPDRPAGKRTLYGYTQLSLIF